MGQLTDHQVADIAHGAGFRGEGLVLAVAVALAESGGRTDAVNTEGNTPPSRDRGLWQINSYWHPEVSDAQAFDPYTNAAAAYRISSHGTDWTQWATYTGGAYREYLPRATRVAGLAQAAHGTAGPFTLTRVLHLAVPVMTGADVAAAQHRTGAPADGTYGAVTRAAVQAFQRRTGITPDGVVGPVTAKAMGWEWAA